MISVTIKINGHTIYHRSANRIKNPNKRGNAHYHCDEGTIISHKPKDGAISLSKKLLDTIDELKEEL